MHAPIPRVGAWLRRVVGGYFNYHAVPTNTRAVQSFRYHVTRLWQRTLARRSQTGFFSWERMQRLVRDYLPAATLRHPWPDRRFDVKHPRQELYARIGHVRICAGGAR